MAKWQFLQVTKAWKICLIIIISHIFLTLYNESILKNGENKAKELLIKASLQLLKKGNGLFKSCMANGK
jgi:hypothetical protein